MAMNTLLNMYRAYKRGTAIPGIDRFPGVDIVGAEEAMRAQCREMSRDLFHFLGESGEVPEAHAISTSFFKGDSCWAVQWNDFQRMFRCLEVITCMNRLMNGTTRLINCKIC